MEFLFYKRNIIFRIINSLANKLNIQRRHVPAFRNLLFEAMPRSSHIVRAHLSDEKTERIHRWSRPLFSSRRSSLTARTNRLGETCASAKDLSLPRFLC
jgi:hypothetical protein